MDCFIVYFGVNTILIGGIHGPIAVARSEVEPGIYAFPRWLPKCTRRS